MIDQIRLSDTLQKINASLNKRFEKDADLYISKQSSSHDVTVDPSGLKPGTHKVNIEYNQNTGSIDYMVNPSDATVIIYQKVSETRTESFLISRAS